MQRWRSLLNSLEIVENKGHCLSTEEQLIEFEARLGFVLPAAYKEFCQVFGGGTFGNFIDIWCPTSQDAAYNYKTDTLRDSIEILSSASRESNDVASIQVLLDSAFIFGGNDSYTALWDLRTYREADQSYDIYWILSRIYPGEIHLVCRDFFEFVQDFCLGAKSYEFLTADMYPLPRTIPGTFTKLS